MLNTYKVQTGAKAASASGALLPPRALLAVTRKVHAGNGEEIKHAVPTAGGWPGLKLAAVGGWEKLCMKFKTLMVSLGWAYDATEPVWETQSDGVTLYSGLTDVSSWVFHPGRYEY